jgi:hypothetical protein
MLAPDPVLPRLKIAVLHHLVTIRAAGWKRTDGYLPSLRHNNSMEVPFIYNLSGLIWLEIPGIHITKKIESRYYPLKYPRRNHPARRDKACCYGIYTRYD